MKNNKNNYENQTKSMIQYKFNKINANPYKSIKINETQQNINANP